ncbi:hypothetical protein Tco_0239079, partial [Tanacetum coccineum]
MQPPCQSLSSLGFIETRVSADRAERQQTEAGGIMVIWVLDGILEIIQIPVFGLGNILSARSTGGMNNESGSGGSGDDGRGGSGGDGSVGAAKHLA